MTSTYQPGFPYPGWTMPQYRYWAGRARRDMNRERASFLADVALAVAAGQSKKAVDALKKRIRQLDGRPERIDTGDP